MTDAAADATMEDVVKEEIDAQASAAVAPAEAEAHQRKRKRDDDQATDDAEGEQKRPNGVKTEATASPTTAAAVAPSVKKVKQERDEEEDERPSFGGGGLGLGFADSGSSDAAADSSSNGATNGSSSVGGGGIGSKLLKLAGYSGVGGLGKRGTGITAPVEASSQMATEGLGFQSAVKRQAHSFEAFAVQIEITPTWLIAAPATPQAPAPALPTTADMAGWIREGNYDPLLISDEHYCSGSLQATLLTAKSTFDDVPSRLFRSARERSNPFELIKGEFFQNRAALKMAEMDVMCGRIFTSPPTARAARKRELVFVGDICAGPGGFSEYMLTVLKWRAVVCGFTLRDGASDFNTTRFNINAPTLSFHAFYGKDGTGDITKTDNMRDYQKKVLEISKGKGLHVVMGDGGFSVVGRENYQEYLSRQLVLCQFVTAFATLAKGGVFVCKLFDSFLPFTVDLLWIVRTHFTHFSLVKPNQSRPANSERYVVAHGFRQFNPPVIEYLYRANDRINELKRTHLKPALSNFPSSRDEATRARDRRIQESARNTTFLSGGRIGGTAEMPAPDASVVKSEPTDGTAIAAAADSSSSSTADASSAASSSPAPAAAPAPTLAPAPVYISSERDVLGLVPEHLVATDTEFCAYMRDRNESIARRQVFTLHRLKQYVEDPGLRPDDQEAVRQQCLKFWCLSQEPLPPMMPPPPPPRPPPPPSVAPGTKVKKDVRGPRRSKNPRRRRRRSRSRSRSGSDSDSDRSRRSDSRTGSSRSRSRSTSRSSGSSRSSGRSCSPTPPPEPAPPAPSTAVVPAAPTFPKLYVHFDPLWRSRLFDPRLSVFNQAFPLWTSEAARGTAQDYMADALKKTTALLPLPDAIERGKLRMTNPSDPRLVQLEALASSARSWYILPVPAGGTRHTVWFGASGMGHINADGTPLLWQPNPPMKVPADTLLDAVWSNSILYVIDAFCLPTPADLAMYRTRPRLLERRELVDMFIESCGEPRLQMVKPVPLLEWRKSTLREDLREDGAKPTFDLFLLRDGDPARPSSATISYSWSEGERDRLELEQDRKRDQRGGDSDSDNDEFPLSFHDVDELLSYVLSKQQPQPTPPQQHQQQQQRPRGS